MPASSAGRSVAVRGYGLDSVDGRVQLDTARRSEDSRYEVHECKSRDSPDCMPELSVARFIRHHDKDVVQLFTRLVVKEDAATDNPHRDVQRNVGIKIRRGWV